MHSNTGIIDLGNPVNYRWALNQGLIFWCLCLPGLMGGAQWHDLSSLSGALTRGNHGTLMNMANASPPGGTSGWNYGGNRPGGFGALRFDGADDFVNFGDKDVFTPGSTGYTIAAWMKRPSAGGNGSILAKYNATKEFNFGWLNSILYSWGTDASVVSAGRSVANTDVDAWHWYGTTFEGGTIAQTKVRLYRDGARVDTTNFGEATGGVISNQNVPLSACNVNVGTGAHLAGAMDDLRFYHCSLSDAQMTHLYYESLAGYPQGLNRARPRHGIVAGAAPFISRQSVGLP